MTEKRTVTIDLRKEMEFAVAACEGPLSKGAHGYFQVFIDLARSAVADTRSRYVEATATEDGMVTLTADSELFEDIERIESDAKHFIIREFT